MIRSMTRSTLNNEVWYQNMLAGNATFIPNSFELIQTTLITTNTSTVTFSSIPQTYRHLELRYVYVAGSNGGAPQMTINGDTTSNYARHGVTGFNGGVNAFGNINAASMNVAGLNVGGNTTSPQVAIVTFTDYSSTTKLKVIRTLWGIAGTLQNNSENGFYSGLWRTGDPITSFTITSGGANWANGSRLSLYGIRG